VLASHSKVRVFILEDQIAAKPANVQLPGKAIKKLAAKKRRSQARVSWKRQSAVPIDKFGKCEHGVPFPYACAVCKPEQFRRETGID
jgi:hypothetical protein